MGCINASTEDGEMVLSRSDFHLAIQKRNHYLKLLSDFVKNGAVLYVGYSFKDRIVTDIIKDLQRIHGKDKMPWGYWLYRDDIPTDEKTKYFFSNNKIIPIKIKIQDFFDFLDSKTISEKPNTKTPASQVKFIIKGKVVKIDDDFLNLLSSYFEVLNEKTLNQDSGKKDDFLMGKNSSWGAYQASWDFKREIYETIFKTVRAEIDNLEVENNKIFKISGMPGVGKTFLLKRLAFDIYSKNNTPVLIHNNTYKFDFKAITSVLEEINKKYDENFDFETKTKQIKYTFVFDDAALNFREIVRLKDYLTSRGRQILIITCDRENEWQKSLNEISYSFPSEWGLDENLTDKEFSSLVDYLFENEYISTKSESFVKKIQNEYDSSFFATIYSLVHPTKKPLNEIIKDQYNGLNELSKSAFEYICCLSQFNIPINAEWLVRIMGCSYQDFIDDVIKKDAAKIIFEIQDIDYNLMYGTHHRIIAQKTLDFFLPDSKILFEKYKQIIEKIEFSNNVERNLAERFLIRNFSVNSQNDKYSIEQRIELFKIACKSQKTRTVLHHLGLLEMEISLMIDAEIHLRDALSIKDNIELFRGESDQNILTSLGKLYSREAINILKKENSTNADELINKASRCFAEAKHGEYPNIHAYHSHAFFWFKRGQNANNEAEKLLYFSNSIEILNSAKDNINEDELLPIFSLEQDVWSHIGIEEKIESISETIKTNFDSPKGYYLSGLFYLSRAKKCENFSEKDKVLKNAFRKTEKALKHFPQDENCLQLRCKIYREYSDVDLSEYYALLHAWYINNGSDNVFLLFELGRTSFILDYFDLSTEVFNKLQSGIGMGNNLRSRPRNPIINGNSNKKFFGEISDIFNKMEGFKNPMKSRKPVVCDYFGLIKLSGFFLFISSLLVVMLSGLQGYNNLRL
jgi:hypothetical protein